MRTFTSRPVKAASAWTLRQRRAKVETRMSRRRRRFEVELAACAQLNLSLLLLLRLHFTLSCALFLLLSLLLLSVLRSMPSLSCCLLFLPDIISQLLLLLLFVALLNSWQRQRHFVVLAFNFGNKQVLGRGVEAWGCLSGCQGQLIHNFFCNLFSFILCVLSKLFASSLLVTRQNFAT